MAVQIDGSQGSVIATSGDYSGGVSIGGTLTYEDVTNIDAVGLITARSGIEIGASPGVGASISVDGNAIFSGITTVTGDVSISDKIIHTGDTNTAIRFPSADTVTVETGGTERTRVSDLGLRIGTNSTTASTAGDDLVIEGASDRGLSIISGSSSSANIYFGDSGDADIGRIMYNHNDNAIQFYTNAANNPVIIDSSGRFGIQGAATKALLDVRASGGSATMLTACFGANEGTTAGTLSDNTDKAARVGLYHYDTDEEPYALFSSGGTNGANSINFGGGTSLMNAATQIGFYTAADSTTTTGTERLKIDSSGNINQTIGASAIGFDQTAAGDHVIRNIASSNRSGASAAIFFQRASWNGNTVAELQFLTGADTTNKDDGQIAFLTTPSGGSNTERLRITQDGAVGINQTNPSKAKLHVVGPSSAADEIIAKFKGGTGADCKAKIGLVAGYSDTANDLEAHCFIGALRSGSGNTAHLSVETYNGTSVGERFRVTNTGSVGILAGSATATIGNGEIEWPTAAPLHLKYCSNTSSSTSGSYCSYFENVVGTATDAGDINRQKSWIGMAFHDSNANNRPQVKFGAEVGERGDANSQPKEGSGNFVVYTATGNNNYDDNATEKFVVQYNGTATISGSTVTSDARLKTDITTLTGALDKVKQLRGVEYLWNDVAIENRGMSNREDGEKQIGVIADEVKPIYPALVDDNGLRGKDDTLYKQVAYERLVPVLIEAVKELSAKVEALESI